MERRLKIHFGASGFGVGKRTGGQAPVDADHPACPLLRKEGLGEVEDVGAMRTNTAHASAHQPAETRPHLPSPYEGEASERGRDTVFRTPGSLPTRFPEAPHFYLAASR